MATKYNPVVLAVLDGFGVNITNPESTWRYAEMKNFHEIEKFYPFTTIQASGIAVGLPWGEEGNSEVWHLTMGAGRTLFHHLPRIITSIKNVSVYRFYPPFFAVFGSRFYAFIRYAFRIRCFYIF